MKNKRLLYWATQGILYQKLREEKLKVLSLQIEQNHPLGQFNGF